MKKWVGAGAVLCAALSGCNLGAPRVDVAGTGGYVLAAGDLDGDGAPELVAGYLYADAYQYNIAVARRDGAGGFVGEVVAPGRGLTDVAVADIDGDGAQDIVQNDYYTRMGQGFGVSVLLGDGAGGVTGRVDVPATASHGYGARLAAGDLHGDGHVDVALVDSWVEVYANDGAGALQAAEELAVPGFVASAVAVADLDGDGAGDLVLAGTGEGPSSGGRVAVLRSDGAGGFAAPAQYPVSDARGRAVAVGDMTGDGRPDVVVGGEGPTTGGSIAVLAGAGGGALGPAVVTRSGAATDVELGDLDEDGVLDVVTAEARQFVVSFGDGQGGIAARHVLVAPRDIASDVAVADMTGDGVLDVAGVGIPADPVAIYPNALDGARTHP